MKEQSKAAKGGQSRAVNKQSKVADKRASRYRRTKEQRAELKLKGWDPSQIKLIN